MSNRFIIYKTVTKLKETASCIHVGENGNAELCRTEKHYWSLVPISSHVLAHSRFFSLAEPTHVFLNQFFMPWPYFLTLTEFQFCKTRKDGGTLWLF